MRWAGAFVLAGAAALASDASASPEDLFGYGTRAPAMGAGGAATARGYEAAYANPALISLERDKRLTLGLVGATFDLHADGAGSPGRVSVLPARGLLIGADVPLPLGGALKDRVGAALAFYTPTDVIVRGRILYPETPQFPLLSDRAQSLAIRLGVGADLGHGLRLGLGFAALAEIAGSVIVATDASGRVGSRVEDQLIATYAPIGGLSYERTLEHGESLLRVGATVRGTLDARFAVTIDATKLSSLNIPVFNIAGLAQYDPLEAALEAAWIRRDFTVLLGVTYKHWSDYPGPLEPTILCPADEPDCGALQPTRIPFGDTVVPRLGIEKPVPLSPWAVLRLRAGYFFEPSPVPSTLAASSAFDAASRTLAPVPTRFFDADRHAITMGLGFAIERPLKLNIDWTAQAHVLAPRDVTLQGGGASGGDATAKVSGAIWMSAISAGVGF